MGQLPSEVWVALAAFLGVLALVFLGDTPLRPRFRRPGRIPRLLELEEIAEPELPNDAYAPLRFLTERLGQLGFEPAGPPMRIVAAKRVGRSVSIVPFLHRHEAAYFLMGIESNRNARSELLLHIITPLEDERRLETSTLEALDLISPPRNVDARVVLDADSVEEIWSRHRLALTRHPRSLRQPVADDAWRQTTQEAYQEWIQAAVRAQRLQLEPNGQTYRVRKGQRSVL